MNPSSLVEERRGQVVTAVSVLYVFVLVSLLVYPFSPREQGRVFEVWWDFFHLPAFSVLSFLLLRILARHHVALFRWWLWLFPAVAFVEVVQYMVGREPSLQDMFHGWAGCLVGGCAFVVFRNSMTWRYRVVGFVVCVLIIGGALYLPFQITMDERRVSRQFPVLAAFNSPWEESRWVITGCDVEVHKNGWSVQWLGSSEYPGLFLRTVNQDWSAVNDLCVEVDVEGTSPLAMWIRVDDRRFPEPAYGQRYQRRFVLPPDRNRVCVNRAELTRSGGDGALDLHAIATFGLFFEHADRGRRITLNRVYLDLVDKELSETSMNSLKNSEQPVKPEK